MFAALNSLEPPVMQIVSLDVFNAGKAWTKEARPGAVEFVRARLIRLEEALGEQAWFSGRFTAADILMTTVLRMLKHTDILDEFPRMAAYKSRGEARPAFARALADQLTGLGEPIKLGEPA
jgi:glutathione S-transferase